MRSKTPSSGDRLLLAELARRGCPISLTQIERWRYWRKTGLVPRTVKHGKGRGTYSELPNLLDAAERVCEVAQLRERYRDLDDIALVLSPRGRPLAPASVKDALLAALTKSERAFRSHKPTSNDPLEIAGNAERALRRAYSRGKRTRSIRAQVNAPLVLPQSLALIAARILAGDSNLGTSDLEEAGSLAELLRPVVDVSSGPIIALLGAARSQMSFSAIRATVTQADPHEVPAALQKAKNLLDGFVPLGFFPSETSRDVAVVGAAIAELSVHKVQTALQT